MSQALGLLSMKRPIAIGIAAAIMSVSAAFAAPDAHLHGPLEGGGRASVDSSSGHTAGTAVRKYQWHFEHITVICHGKTRLTRFPVDGGFSINAQYDGPGPWGVHGTASGDSHHPDVETLVYGRLTKAGDARGWIRVFGRAVPLKSGRHADCDSGHLHWVAQP
jgi:hypothetical protein